MKPFALTSILLMSSFAAAVAAPVAPTVVSGQATFNQQGNVFSITNTPNAIINWQSFSVQPGEITRFIQQNANSAVLNRILGQDPSQILGALESNGKVVLINPNGVLFGNGARVDVQGLVASSLNISNADFLAGKMQFQGAANAGAVRNLGSVATPSGGSVFLIAPTVENNGVITAPNGQVILAAGHSVRLVDSANPDMQVVVSAPEAKAINLGDIVAQAGRVGIYGALVEQRGKINADSAVLGANGKIVLKASKLAQFSAGSDTRAAGGVVQVEGEQVALLGDARIDVSAAGAGGQVLLGGGYQGKDAAVSNAQQTYVSPASLILANAIGSGDGGKIIAWGDGSTQFYGTAQARGGAMGGQGGLIETSSKALLDVAGARIDASAAKGAQGMWLLDPTDVTISHGSSNSLSSGVFSPSSSNSIGDSVINAALAAGTDVTIQTSGGSGGSGIIKLNGSSDSGGAAAIVNTGGTRSLTLSSTTVDMRAGSSITSASGNALTLNLNASSGSTFDGATIGGTINTTGNFTLNHGLVLDNGAVLNLGSRNMYVMGTGAQSLSTTGSATVNMAGSSIYAGYSSSGQTFTIGSGLSLQGYGSITHSTSASVVNQGTIIGSSNTMTVNPASFSNSGTLRASGGSLVIDPTTWANTGTVQIDSGAAAYFDFDTTTAGLGTIVHNAGSLNFRGILDNSARGSGNPLDIGAAGSFGTAGLTSLSSGTIQGGYISSSDGRTLNGGTLDGSGISGTVGLATSISVKNGLNLASGAVLNTGSNTVYIYGNGAQSFGGANNATVNMAGSTLYTGYSATGQVLTIGSGVTVQGYGSIAQSSNATLSNSGTIISNGGTLTIDPQTLTNSGTVRALGGTLTLNPTNWTNTGTLQVDAGAIANLDFDSTTAGLGTIVHSAGTLNYRAILDNSARTSANPLDFGAAGPFGTAGLSSLSGTIQGGYVTSSNGQVFAGGGTLDATSLAGTLTLASGLSVRNGLGFVDGAVLNIANNTVYVYGTGTQNFTTPGAATINMAGGTLYSGYGSSGQTLYLGSGMTVQGYGSISQSSNATVSNQGTINASSNTLTINPQSFVNNGIVRANGGILTLNPTNWTNTGSLVVNSGATANLDFDTTTAGLGSITHTAGTLNYRAILDNSARGSGNPLDIGSTGPFGTAGLTALSGTILGGYLNSSNGQNLSGGTLDGVTLAGTVNLSGGLSIRNSLNLANGAVLNAGANTLYIYGTGAQSLATSGAATINLADGTIYSGYGSSGQTLTLSSGLTVQGYGYISQSSSANVVNNGSVISNGASHTLNIVPNSFTNAGSLRSAAGTLVIDPNTWINTGTLQVDTGSTANLDFNSTTAGLGTIVHAGGNLNFRAVLDNSARGSGNPLDLGATGPFGAAGLTNLTGTIQGGYIRSSDGRALTGGTLDNVGVLGSLDITGGLAIKNTLGLLNGAVLNAGNNTLYFYNSGANGFSTDGSATVNLAGATLYAGYGSGGQTMSIPSGVTVQGYGYISQSSAATVVNAGTIIGNSAANTLTINPSTFSNSGMLRATAGTLTIDPSNWTNTGTLRVDTGATANLDFNTTTAGLGTIVHGGGTLNYRAILDNSARGSGNPLDLGASGPFGTAGLNNMSGTILGGYITSSDGRQLSGGGTLDGVSIAGTLDLTSGLSIKNSLGLANGAVLNIGNNTIYIDGTGAQGINAVSGTATVNASGSYFYLGYGSGGQVFNLGSGVTLQGYGTIANSSAATLSNQGSIIANSSGNTFSIYPSTVINNGILGASAGTLTIDPSNWTNNGSVQVGTGAIANLDFDTSTAGLGTITHAAGSLNFRGILDNSARGSANPLDIGAAGPFGTAGLTSMTGTIVGGYLTSSSANTLGGSTIDGVSLAGTVGLSGSLVIKNGLNMSNGAVLNAGAQTVYVYGSGNQSISSPGTATINLAGGTLYTGYSSPGQNFVLGSGMTVQGSGYVSQYNTSNMNNLGSIISNTAGQDLHLVYDNLQNAGTVRAAGGNMYIDVNSWSNAGSLQVDSGAAYLDFDSTTAGLGNIVHTGGALAFRGVLDNSARTSGNPLNIGGGGSFGAAGLTSLGGFGTISGGYISSSDSTPLGQGNLTGVGIVGTLNTDGTLSIRNGLTLANGATLNLNNNTLYMYGSGTQAISTPGSAIINMTSASMIPGIGSNNDQVFDIGSGVSVQGYGSISANNAATLLNHGSILATNAAQTLYLSSNTLNNAGTLGATVGTLYLYPTSFTNNGTILVNGGTFSLNSNLSIASLGTVVHTGGAIDYSGTFNNSASTANAPLDIGSNGHFGALGLNSFAGTLNGGYLTGSGGAVLDGGTLDGVTIKGTLGLGGYIIVKNGLAMADQSVLNAGNNYIYLYGTGAQGISTTGTATINLAGGVLNLGADQSGQLFTLGSGVTVQGYGSIAESYTTPFTNNGTVTNNAGSHTMFISPTSLTNNGSLRATAGTLSVSHFPSNAGTIDISSGASFSTGGAALANNGIVSGSGTLSLSGGVLTNNGNIYPGGNGTVGTLNISGKLTNASTGAIHADVASASSYDKVAVSSTATLGGTLNIGTVGSYQPGNNEQYTLLSYSGLPTGTFATINAANFSGAAASYATSGSFLYKMPLGIATNVWNFDGNGDWADPTRWSLGHVPLSSEDVQVPDYASQFTISLLTGAQQVRSVVFLGNDHLSLMGGTLSLSNASTLSAGYLDMSGASALNAGGALTLKGFSLAGTSVLNLATGAQMSVADYAQTGGVLNGTGTLIVNNSINKTAGSIANTLAGIAITQATGNLFVGNVGASNSLILAAPHGSLTVGGALTGNFVQLDAGTSIINSGGSVVANSLLASAVNGIGAASPLITQVGSLQAQNVGSGNVQISNSGRNLAVVDIVGSTGIGVKLLGTGSLTLSNTGGFDITTSVPLQTANGSIQVSAKDLVLASAVTAPGNAVNLVASGALTAANVNGASLAAVTGAGANVVSSVSNLAVSNTGSASNIAVSNTGALTVGAVSQAGGGSITIVNAGATTVTGPVSSDTGGIAVVAHSPLTVNGSITSSGGGGIYLEAGSGNGTADVLSLGSAAVVTSSGSLTLKAGDAINIASGATVSAGATQLPNQNSSLPTLGACTTTPSLPRCAEVLPTLATCISTPSTTGCTAVLPSQETCNTTPSTPGCSNQAPTLATCISAPNTSGCSAVLPSLATCTTTPSTLGCSVVLPSLAACTSAPSTAGCSAVLPSLASCTSSPSTAGCSAVLPSLASCTSAPSTAGCSAVLPSLATCISSPSTAGCTAVLPSLASCTSAPSTAGCSAVLPSLASCTSSPSTSGCSAVLPSLASCTSAPSTAGCSAVLPSLATCISSPSAQGCSAVLPSLATCISAPSTAGCSVILPTLATCISAPGTVGCGVILPSLAACISSPTQEGCSVILPNLSECTSAPTTAGCSVVLPALSTCISAPATAGCSVVLPSLASCTSTPSTAGCSAVLPSLTTCAATPSTAGCSAVLPSLATCTATPSTPGCSAVLPSLATCTATPSTAGCSLVLPSLASCTAAPSTSGCSAVLPSLAVCTVTPSTAGCSAVLPSLAACTLAPTTAGCSAVLPSLSACTSAPTTAGCSAVLPSLSVCTSAPATSGCSAVLPSLATCTNAPSTAGCSAVLPSLASCTATPSATGCSAVLPSLATCTTAPTTVGCSVVLPTLATCISAPASAGCSAVLPSLATCTSTPSTAGCSAVLPNLATCISTPAKAGCAAVLPSLATCTATPSTAGCQVVLPSLATCTSTPTTAGCTAVLPSLATCTATPSTAGCQVVLPSLATCSSAPTTAGCAAVLPSLATCTASPSTAGCAAVLPSLATCTSAPGTAGCSAVLPSLTVCLSAPNTAGCSAVLPSLATCIADPGVSGCQLILPSLASCISAPRTAGCSAVLPSLSTCVGNPGINGCSVVLPSLSQCIGSPGTPGCDAVLPNLASCISNPGAAGCQVVLPTLGTCISAPATDGCSVILPSLASCISAPASAGCTVVLPTLAQCTLTPGAAGCSVVLPSLNACVLNPGADGCSAVLPKLAACIASPSTAGCSVVLPSLASCTSTPSTSGCSVVLPSLSACIATPARAGCSAVLPSLASCTASPASAGCSVVLPSLALCTSAPATAGCSAVLPSLLVCTGAPSTAGCSAVLPSLSTCLGTPGAAGCSAVLPSLSACTGAPTTLGCSVVLPSLSSCTSTPSLAGCSAVLPTLSVCTGAPSTAGCSAVLPSMTACVANPSAAGCTAVLPSLASCIATPSGAGCEAVLPPINVCLASPSTAGCAIVVKPPENSTAPSLTSALTSVVNVITQVSQAAVPQVSLPPPTPPAPAPVVAPAPVAAAAPAPAASSSGASSGGGGASSSASTPAGSASTPAAGPAAAGAAPTDEAKPATAAAAPADEAKPEEKKEEKKEAVAAKEEAPKKQEAPKKTYCN